MFKEALIAAARKLEYLRTARHVTDYALIGAFALSRWTSPRATADIDFVIKTGNLSLQEIARELGGEAKTGDISDPLLGVVTFVHGADPGGAAVQLIQFPAAWEKVALDSPDRITIGGADIPVADWRALVLLKLYAGGPSDLEDARALLSSMEMQAEDRSLLKKRAAALRVSRRLAKVL